MNSTLLELKNLKTHFNTPDGTVSAVDDVNFQISTGETVGIVGESGCGKSVTSLSIMRLLPDTAQISGEISFRGEDLLQKSESQMRQIRGNEMSMIFQEPMTSLNPVYTIGNQISETLRLHQGLDKKQAFNKAIEYLNMVGIPSPKQRAREYPHQLSGGMQQRAMIAMALSCNPQLLIADEPTTALDVTIQAQILELMKDLKQRLSTAIIMITHDLAVVAEMCERVIVMYSGKVVEIANIRELFKTPFHPYTEGLIKSIPKLHSKTDFLYEIEGTVPNPLELPQGCKFHNRCDYASEKCQTQEPELIEQENNHFVRCFYPRNVGGGDL
ncbi:ABC transporter ATP-binding protein [Natranaerobius thermophilus]|uniref:Oligopeptide/dipeptide ABC transporter, ATPase subunit n=1 Tax=Natranaerobius thermophilus (strain ATCC BAA-1301 / DSM 18059 / JW/NM-WN-LF) TaxID=457570 RepID=B2A2T7_NATTJ|nr:ABC transporter ATP-binding protein [Natranaerobius thermophilus]ACB86305.1 oligopeptide/dipeptide ABC transporter, ATPase subunit [Natranaerobius thermophilus JW/NM-WN-LF]